VLLLCHVCTYTDIHTYTYVGLYVYVSVYGQETCNVYKYFTCPERPEKWFQTSRRKRPNDTSQSTRADGAETLYPDIGDIMYNHTKRIQTQSTRHSVIYCHRLK